MLCMMYECTVHERVLYIRTRTAVHTCTSMCTSTIVHTALRFTYTCVPSMWYLKAWRYRLPSPAPAPVVHVAGFQLPSRLGIKHQTTLFHFLNTLATPFVHLSSPWCYTLVRHNMSLFTSNVACNTLWGSHFNRWFLCLFARSPLNPGSVLLIL